ncbi:hypothetical protein BGW42_008606 [Actinomortierella wolfii]|nr:hypothetical protein BGW42_008606 [Actinomortierella wolfii]
MSYPTRPTKSSNSHSCAHHLRGTTPRRRVFRLSATFLLSFALVVLATGAFASAASSDPGQHSTTLDRRSRLWIPPEGAELYDVPIHPITPPPSLQRGSPSSPSSSSPSSSSSLVHFSSKAATPPPSNSTKGSGSSGGGSKNSSVGIGTPAQNFSIVLDTGSSDFWIPSTACTTIVCVGLNRFNANQSSTFHDEAKPFEAKYGDGSFVSGVTGIDTVTLSRQKIANQSFGLAAVDETSVAQKGVEGVLGLNVGRSASVRGYISLVENLISRKVLSQPIVSVWMGRQRLGGAMEGSGGAFILGGVDTTKYVGNFTWLPTVDRNAWKVHMQGLSLGGKNLGMKADVLIDTGTSLIIMPSQAANDFHGNIPRAQNIPQVGWIIPCNTAAGDLNFTLGGQQFRVPQEELIVLFRIPGYQDYCKSAIDVSPTGSPTVRSGFLAQPS